MTMFTIELGVSRECSTKDIRRELDGIIPGDFAILGAHYEMGQRFRRVVFKDQKTAAKVRLMILNEGPSHIYEVVPGFEASLRKKWSFPWEAA